MPQLATSQAGEAAKEAGLLQTVGAAQQQHGQAQLDTQAGTWQEASNWPIQNLDILLSALTGTPYPTHDTKLRAAAASNLKYCRAGGRWIGTAAGIGASIAVMV